MPSDLQVSNIRDLTNANSAISIASDGQVTIAQNNPTITLGSNATISTQDYVKVKFGSSQVVTSNTWVGMQFNTSEHDPNNWFNTSTYKFQPDKAGKYFFSVQSVMYATSGTNYGIIGHVAVKKNDATTSDTGNIMIGGHDARDSRFYAVRLPVTGLIDMNGSSDFLWFKALFYAGSGTGTIHTDFTNLQIFRIGS